MPRTRPLLLAIAIVAMCFSLLILTVIPGQAASVLLSWNAPKANADGTSLTDLAGYKVYSGTSPGNYTSTLDVGNVVSISMGGLQDGQLYYFAVTAYDSMGLESGFSNEASVTPSLDTPIPPPPPLASRAWWRPTVSRKGAGPLWLTLLGMVTPAA